MHIIELTDVVSTNLEAKTYIQTQDIIPTWIRAERQSGGRGRGGRHWTSIAGNLYTSGIYPAFEDEALNAQCSFAAALAVYDVIKTFAPLAEVKIKWPNDVLVEGAKISGILLERACARETEYIIIGIGINIASSPDLEEKSTASVSALGAHTEPCAVLECLIARFEHWYERLKHDGFAPLCAVWTKNAYNLGQAVRTQIGNSVVTGTAECLDTTGALHIRTRDGEVVKVSAGDVFFL